MLLKPSRYERLKAKEMRRLTRERLKRQLDETARRLWEDVRKGIYYRDDGKCRVCSARTYLSARNPLTTAHCHHIIYRSHARDDSPANLIVLCPKCHDDEHRHLISITGTADDLTIQRRD